MNKEHKEVLRKVLVDFMRDLGHVDLIVHDLQLDGVLNESDREHILQQSISRSDKVKELLETLPRRGPNAFESFVKAVNHHQEWFVTRLQTELEEVERSSAENLARKSDSKSKESAVHQKLEHDNKTLLLTVNTLEDKNSCLTKELEEVKEARKNETAANEELKDNNSCLAKELDDVKKAKDDEKLKKETLLNKYEMLTTTHCSEVKNLKDRMENEKLKNEALCIEGNILKDNISYLARQLAEEKQKNEKLKNDNETQKTTHCNEVKNLQDRISSLVRELDEVKEKREKESASHEELKNDEMLMVMM